jgi:glycosyltransferase involved in cell wall biosynthesis
MPAHTEGQAVTVVIPCFNQARFLPAAVASVRAQLYPSVDCIVVNDGSTDDTGPIASGLGVRLLQQPNRGLSEARNAGLVAAGTELVVFLDADDELLPESVAAAAEALSEAPGAAAVVGRCQVMNADGSPARAFHHPIDTSKLYEEWLLRNFVWTPGAAMFRRQALEDIGGFPVGLGPAADYAVYLQLARADRIRAIPRDLVRYRRHDASMSLDPALMLRATLAVLHRERHEAPAPLGTLIDRGRTSWCEWYGEQIVDRIRNDWHSGRRGRAQLNASATLLRHCPFVVMRHLRRKTARVLSSRWPRAFAASRQVLAARRRRVTP